MLSNKKFAIVLCMFLWLGKVCAHIAAWHKAIYCLNVCILLTMTAISNLCRETKPRWTRTVTTLFNLCFSYRRKIGGVSICFDFVLPLNCRAVHHVDNVCFHCAPLDLEPNFFFSAINILPLKATFLNCKNTFFYILPFLWWTQGPREVNSPSKWQQTVAKPPFRSVGSTHPNGLMVQITPKTTSVPWKFIFLYSSDFGFLEHVSRMYHFPEQYAFHCFSTTQSNDLL